MMQDISMGAVTFEDIIKEIFHLMLVFECIPILFNKYQGNVSDVHNGCPRMCNKSFKSLNMRGFPLENLYETLEFKKSIASWNLMSKKKLFYFALWVDVNAKIWMIQLLILGLIGWRLSKKIYGGKSSIK